MTIENRWTFDIADIVQVRIVCTKCAAAFSVTPNDWKRVPPACSNCGEQLYLNASAEEHTLDRFKRALEALAKAGTDRFKVQLEFHGPHV